MFESSAPPPDLLSLNYQLAQSLQTLQTHPGACRQAHLMEHCVHPLDEFIVHGDDEVEAKYCRAALCLLCRRLKAVEERRVLKLLLDAAQNTIKPAPLLFFQTLTLQDAAPAEVTARAALLVRAFSKLRRRLPYNVGWARVIETQSSDIDPNLENVHLHFVMLFPPGLAEDVGAIQWDDLWQKCAGALARDCDPNARMAEGTASVLNYLTKNLSSDFVDEAEIGIADPARYVCRVENGHSKFSCGKLLRFQVFSEADKQCGLDVGISRSTLRSQSRQLNYPIPVEIPIEGAVPRARGPHRRP